jgi:flagellar motor switch protein FliG
MKKRFEKTRRRKSVQTVLALALFASFFGPVPALRAVDPAPAAMPALSPDMYLLEQESKFEREKTEYLQQNILDKVLGPGRAVVIVDVEMGLETKAMEMGMEKKKNTKKKNEAEEGKEAQPAPQARMLVPGVPMPKSVSSLAAPPDDLGGEEKGSGGQLQQKKYEVRTNIKKLLVTVLYDKKVSTDKLQAVKQAIIALLKVTEQQLIFTPTVFTETAWQEVLKPHWLIPLIIILLILLFLWGPLRTFFKRLNAALEDKTQKIEQTLKQESEEESEENAEEDGDQEGGGEGEGDQAKTEEELAAEEEEKMKKFEPFTYVGEQNLKGLAYLLRKEEPWIIALVLSYLKPEYSKEIFVSMPPELQARVAVETATIRQTSLEQVMSIDEYVKKKIDFVLGGIENLIKILNESDKGTRENILDYLRNEKPMLYERVREEVLLFEDILRFPDTAIQGIVREIGTESLSRALRGASPEYLNKFFTNMSAGAAALLKESMDYGRPLTPEQIEDERKALMELVGKLEKDGKIAVRKKRKTGILEGEEAADESEGLHLNASAPKPVPAVKPVVPDVDPVRAQETFQTGTVYYEQGQYPQAIEQFHYAIQAQPDFWQAYQYLGTAYYAQGMVNEAMGAYERMTEINPDPSLRAWVDQWKAQVGQSPRAEAV